MPNWNASFFFYILIAFAVYIFAAGDGPKWKAVFTQKLAAK